MFFFNLNCNFLSCFNRIGLRFLLMLDVYCKRYRDIVKGMVKEFGFIDFV